MHKSFDRGMPGIQQLALHATSSVLDFLYPPVCISCHALLESGRQMVCERCWNAIPPVTRELALYRETRARLVGNSCFSDLVSCYVFEKEGPLQPIAHALKYQEFSSLGIALGERTGRLLAAWNIDIDILIPIPLHPIKLRERSFNQAELIALGISSIVHKPVAPNVVRRRRYTKTQTKLNHQERQKNMENAFEILPDSAHLVAGKRCLLIDDVITTGATISACGKALLLGHPEQIIAASTALAQ